MASPLPSVRGAVRLTFDCLEGLVGVVQQMHDTIARRPMPWAPASGGSAPHGPISAEIYSVLRGISGSFGQGLDRALGAFEESEPSSARTPSRAATILNGICGDHLDATRNPLAIPMTLRSSVNRLDPTREGLRAGLPHATSRIALLVHGLCLSERSWSRGPGPGLGDHLREELGYTPVYLRYNSGRHISTNGRELADQLECLIQAWPVPVESLTLLGHSMGGLVLRSACWYASEARHTWTRALENIVCLGTPHHGAPLEKGGHLFTSTLEAFPYLEPLALGRYRSAGIKDLRHGSLLDEDWQGSADSARPVPLLDEVEYYLVAASLGKDASPLRGRLLGDLFVRPESAMGAHSNELRRLRVPLENCRVFHEMNHFDLLDHPDVHQQILDWLRGTLARPRPPEGYSSSSVGRVTSMSSG